MDTSYDFETLPTWEGFRAIYRHDSISLFFGFSANANRLALWIESKENSLISSKVTIPNTLDSLSIMVSPQHGVKTDIFIELLDEHLKEPFLSLCRDIRILLQYYPKTSNVLGIILRQFEDWKDLLKTAKQWSFKRTKGVLAELLYLKEILIPEIGVDAAINAWEGPFGGDQDFSLEDEWREIKAIVSGRNTVQISSVEQLDSPRTGQLVVFSLDKAANDKNQITLGGLLQGIREGLLNASIETKRRFEDACHFTGLDSCLTLDKYGFLCKEVRRYQVTEGFPCLRQQTLPVGVENIKYTLDLNVVAEFMVIK
jgi:hypothetical protein